MSISGIFVLVSCCKSGMVSNPALAFWPGVRFLSGKNWVEFLIKKVSFNFCVRMELIFMFQRWYATLVTTGVFQKWEWFFAFTFIFVVIETQEIFGMSLVWVYSFFLFLPECLKLHLYVCFTWIYAIPFANQTFNLLGYPRQRWFSPNKFWRNAFLRELIKGSREVCPESLYCFLLVWFHFGFKFQPVCFTKK